MKLRLSEVAELARGVLHGDDGVACGASIDSRAVNVGDLFCALPGERVDGHRFVADAARAGAVAALTTRLIPDAARKIAQIVVADVGDALAELAKSWRRRLTIRAVALTGSNGKTTTKEMLASILRQRYKVAATRGNYNNHFGVPLTLLSVDETDECMVIEMGASRVGDIRHLCELAAPQVGLVLNAGEAHLESFGSLSHVVRAKGELLESLPTDGVGILNADSAHYAQWKKMTRARAVVTFSGEGADADVKVVENRADKIALSIGDKVHWFKPNLLGAHNASNAAAAAATATALDVDGDAIVRGLEATLPVPGRLCRVAGVHESCLIDDSYNANPVSLRAAMTVLVELSGEPWLALGDMLELGEQTADLHTRAGLAARDAGIKRLITVGSASRHASAAFGDDARHFDCLNDAVDYLGNELRADVSLLIKGSRSSGMDAMVRALRDDLGDDLRDDLRDEGGATPC